MMKLGIIGASYPDRYGPVAFEEVGKLGLDFIEVCCNFDPDTDEFIARASETRKLVEQTGIKIGSVGRWNLENVNRGGVIDPVQLDKNIRLMNAAAEVGCPVFVCGCNYDGDVSRYKNYGVAIEYFNRITEEAKKLGIKAAVYNCSWGNFVNKARDWEIVLGDVPELGIKYDCSHAIARGIHTGEYLRELDQWLPRVYHMHVKGTAYIDSRDIDAPPAGMDQTDWNTVFVLLYKHGYNGGLSIEPHSGVWQGALGEAGVKFTVDFLRKYLVQY